MKWYDNTPSSLEGNITKKWLAVSWLVNTLWLKSRFLAQLQVPYKHMYACSIVRKYIIASPDRQYRSVVLASDLHTDRWWKMSHSLAIFLVQLRSQGWRQGEDHHQSWVQQLFHSCGLRTTRLVVQVQPNSSDVAGMRAKTPIPPSRRMIQERERREATSSIDCGTCEFQLAQVEQWNAPNCIRMCNKTRSLQICLKFT